MKLGKILIPAMLILLIYNVKAAAAEEHIYSEWRMVKEPTCTKMGERYKECLLHGGQIIEELLPLEHEYQEEWIEPTCIKEGRYIQTCIRCGDTIEETDREALGHDFEPQVTQEAICGHDGVRTYQCSRCEETYTESIPMLEHEYGSWVVRREAEIEIAGMRYRECIYCQERIYQEIAALEKPEYKLTVLDAALISADGGILVLFFALLRVDIYRILWDQRKRRKYRKEREQLRRDGDGCGFS